MIVALLACLLIGAPPAWEAKTVDGQTVRGVLSALSAARITLQTAAGPASLDVKQVVELAPVESPPVADDAPGAWIELADGSTLIARSYAVRDGLAEVQLRAGPRVQLPTSAVACVRFHDPADAMAPDWARLLQRPRSTDLLVVRKENTIDYHPGVIRDVADDEVLFEIDGERLPVKRPKVAGLVYYHPASPPLPRAVCRLTDVGGSCFVASTVDLSESFQLTTPAGLRLSLPPAAVRKIALASDQILYLSDRNPESVQVTPFAPPDKPLALLELWYAPRVNLNSEQLPLRLGGQTYAKGLTLHARTEIVYRLPDRFRQFKATAGIDDAVRPRGRVRLVVRGDDRLLWEKELTGSESPVEIDVGISGVRRLVIVADFGRRIGMADYVLLAEPRVVR